MTGGRNMAEDFECVRDVALDVGNCYEEYHDSR